MAGKRAVVDYRTCDPKQCEDGVCSAALVCPRKLLKQEAPYEVPMADSSTCRACSDCVRSCPAHAIELVSGP